MNLTAWQIVLASSAVSLLTLVICLWMPYRKQPHHIPTAFLGHLQQPAALLKTAIKIPWFIWLCIFITTLGASIAYFPYQNKEQRPDQNHTSAIALVWIDSTFSAVLARKKQGDKALSYVSQQLLSLQKQGYDLIGLQLSEELFFKNQPQPFVFKKLMDENDLKDFVKNEFEKLTFLHAPIEGASLKTQLLQHPLFMQKNIMLTAISDGQRGTLQPLIQNNNIFKNVKLIAFPGEILSGKIEEWVPQDLVAGWEKIHPHTSAEVNQFLLPYNEDTYKIPKQARPGIFKETYHFANHSLNIFTHQTTAALPLFSGHAMSRISFIFCSGANEVPFQEIDSFADIRIFAKHFDSAVRFLHCDYRDQNAQQAQEAQRWKYRGATIWVIPMEEDVYNTLSIQKKLWYPEGYNPDMDAVIYVAGDKYAENDSSFISSNAVQLEHLSPPLRMNLAPLPPLDFNPPFQNIYKAADNTPLGFRLQQQRVFWLRTPTALPHLELGRSRGWIEFWMTIAQTLDSDTMGVKFLQIGSPAEWYKNRDQLLKKYNFFELSETLDQTNFQLIPTKLENSLQTLPRLYKNNKTNTILIAEISAKERDNNFLTQDEVANLVEPNDQPEKQKNLTSTTVFKKHFLISFFGTLCALIAVCLLWLKTPFYLILLLTVVIAPQQYANASTNELQTAALSPRIAWCDAHSKYADQNYEQLRFKLHNTGTVELPKKLLFGACQVHAAEIWWTDSFDAFANSNALEQHIQSGGVFVLEGYASTTLPPVLQRLAKTNVGLIWEQPQRHSMLYRSFFLLQSFDGCFPDTTQLLMLKKSTFARSPVGIVTRARFLSSGEGCFFSNSELQTRSFTNMIYSFLATDYKEDQLQLPEVLAKIRRLGLEP